MKIASEEAKLNQINRVKVRERKASRKKDTKSERVHKRGAQQMRQREWKRQNPKRSYRKRWMEKTT